MRSWWLLAGLIALLAVTVPRVFSASPDDAGTEFFEKKIRSILIANCYECHSEKAKKLKGGLRLDTREGVRKGGDSGPVIVPGRPKESLLLKAIRYTDDELKMPPKGKLPDAAIADLERWIAIGAPDPRTVGRVSNPSGQADSLSHEERRKHWAFQPPRRHAIPSVKNAVWPRSDLDRFVFAKLEANGLRPAPDADRYTLLRRVTFDLAGLPPTPAEIQAFISDASPEAFSKVVDRLLGSPAFGERWGRHWLDLAQYADTVSIDRLFPDKNAWRYRDYVIRSFNEDKPFDQFVREQIAGDLMPLANDCERRDRIVATAFLTHGPIQTINQFKEQLRWDIVDNQVSKVGQAFLGLTLGCARCHDHKFDPVMQNDYYALAGILQNLQLLNGFLGSSKVFSDWHRVPLPETPEDRAARERATAEHARTKDELERQKKEAQDRVVALQKKIKELKAAKKPAQPEIGKLEKELAAAEKKNGELDLALISHVRVNAPEPPSMFAAKEVPTPTNAKVTIRGNAYQLGPEVPRGFVQVVSPGDSAPGSLSRSIPPNASGRLQLAEWLTDPKNPLTARVIVNRIWHHVFGAGIVRSVDNFGLRGDRPTHPELLDYLAMRFVEQAWSVKTLIREMLLSRTYQMSSEHNSAAFAVDPDNKLLWRLNRRRLEAEAMCDAILQVSGQLDQSRGGPSLPAPGWLGGAVNEYVLIIGEPPPPASVVRRRTVYLPVFRRPPPWADGLTLFNTATPSVITGARTVTTVPTQSLYLMNSPFLIEQGRRAAERLLAQKHPDDAGRVRAFYVEALSRPAREEEVQRALDFIGRITSESGRTEAWAMFCHAMFASNEFLIRS